jgi:hypothetical protein
MWNLAKELIGLTIVLSFVVMGLLLFGIVVDMIGG